jgi:hypothetical protein
MSKFEIIESETGYGGLTTRYYIKIEDNEIEVGFARLVYFTLEFDINIDEKYRNLGVFKEILKRSLGYYSPKKVKTHWKKSKMYDEGESINLKIYRESKQQGKTRDEAAFETITGKLLKRHHFDKIESFEKDTDDEVIIYFISTQSYE